MVFKYLYIIYNSKIFRIFNNCIIKEVEKKLVMLDEFLCVYKDLKNTCYK